MSSKLSPRRKYKNVLQVAERTFRELVGHVWKEPKIGQTVRFIVQELGEADSIIMRLFDGQKFFRSRETAAALDEYYDLTVELGQTMIMLLTLMSQCEVDANVAISRAIAHTTRKLYTVGKIDLNMCSAIASITSALDQDDAKLSRSRRLVQDKPTYEEGRLARAIGAGLLDCPYTGDQRHYWVLGWNDAAGSNVTDAKMDLDGE